MLGTDNFGEIGMLWSDASYSKMVYPLNPLCLLASNRVGLVETSPVCLTLIYALEFPSVKSVAVIRKS